MKANHQYNAAFTNLDHEYGWVSHEAAHTAGYQEPENMLGTTVFELNCDVANIAEYLHKLNTRILRERHEIVTVDVCHYPSGIEWCVNKKSPKYSKDKRLEGIYTESQISTHLNTASLFIAELYHRAVALNQDNKFSGLIYEVVDSYDNYGLNKQESKVLFLLAHGKSMKKIAALIFLSPRTVEFHVDRIKQKLRLKNKEQLIEHAIYNRLIDRIPKSLVFNT